eukprot:3402182-Ditylum_brightwellii.AAC.1
MPSTDAAIATVPSPPAAAVSALLSAGLLQQFMDPTFQQLAAYFPYYQVLAAVIGAIAAAST